MVLSSLKTLLWTYWPHLVLLLVAGIVIAWKLRLMKKFGFYLVGVGVFFFSSGMVTAGNPILLLIGNAFFLAGTYMNTVSQKNVLLCLGKSLQSRTFFWDTV